jgi:Cu/Ag efflux protein CusF
MVLVAAALSVLLVTVAMAAESGKMETATGKVTSIDPQGKAITISAKMGGKEAMDVGTVVDENTIVKVKGKKATLDDIKVGDTVTIRYLKSDNLYAKEIMKK